MPPLKQARMDMTPFPSPSKSWTATPSQRKYFCDHIARSKGVNIHGPHVSLFFEPFGLFIDSVKDTATVPPHPFPNMASRIVEQMSAAFTGRAAEAERTRLLQRLLQPIGSFEHYQFEGLETDLTLKCNGRAAVNIEVKNDIGKASNNPVDQNQFYYMHLTNNGTGLDPMFLISVCGGFFLQVFGAIRVGEYVLHDPLCGPVSLLCVPDDTDEELKLARVLHALYRAIPSLKEYYGQTRTNSCQPYYNFNGAVQYIKKINNNVWEAVYTTDAEPPRGVIVKFTKQYSCPVHNCLSEYGMAPRLIATEDLPGGWKVILMDKIEGKTLHNIYFEKRSPATVQQEAIKSQLKSMLSQIMKPKNYVHGDLRLPNVMLKDNEISSTNPTPLILDFDWAGVQGEVVYPPHLNPEAHFPPGVQPYAMITSVHDEEMVECMFALLSNIP